MKQPLYLATLLFACVPLTASDLLNGTGIDLVIQVRDRQSNLLLNAIPFLNQTAIELAYQCDQFPLRLQATEVGRATNRNSCVLIGRQHCVSNIYVLRVTRKEDGSNFFYIEAYPRATRGYVTEEIPLTELDEENNLQ